MKFTGNFMIKIIYFIVALVFFSLAVSAQNVTSPNGNLSLNFKLTASGEPSYQLSYKNKAVINDSKMGFELADAPEMKSGFAIVETRTDAKNETWNPVWGEVKTIRSNYKELAVTLEQKGEKMSRKIVIRFRLFDDGLGFRYEFPVQNDLKYFVVNDEKTEFNLTGDHKTFWIPGDYDSQEYAYNTTNLSEINTTKSLYYNPNSDKIPFAENAVQTPVMLKSADGIYINIHEAALVDYPAMYLAVDRAKFGLVSHLAPNAVGSSAFLQTPAKTPWRTVIVSDKATDILASKMILNLNEPTKYTDTSYIKPQKFVGVWWEMHINTGSWNYADINNVKIDELDWKAVKSNGKHSANTANVKRYIDFAAKNNIQGVLVEGWNVGWEDWYGNWKENVCDFVTPYPDFDVQELHKYAASKGVKLIMHHETSASASNYERRLDSA